MRQTSLTTSYLYKASNHDLIPLLHVGHITLHYNYILHMTHVQHVPNIYPHSSCTHIVPAHVIVVFFPVQRLCTVVWNILDYPKIKVVSHLIMMLRAY